LLSQVDLEQRVPSRHPLRAMREIVNEALGRWTTSFKPFTHRRAPIDLTREGIAITRGNIVSEGNMILNLIAARNGNFPFRGRVNRWPTLVACLR
jgi:hypothetical protein